MEIMTSYFYQVRNMKPYMIPLSTAVWDPKWFHQNKGHKFQWIDKNGVINGLRADPFVPGKGCEGLCSGPPCGSAPQYCNFLQAYKNQLDNLNYNNILWRFQTLGYLIKNELQFREDPVYILLVHEAYDNLCSERWMIQKYFHEHGLECKEFNK